MLSVHTVVSFDFAVSVIPGWHATVFPPYFVAGAIFSGFAMVLTLMIPCRQLYGLQDLVTDASSGHDESCDAGDKPDGGLRLWHRILHGLV